MSEFGLVETSIKIPSEVKIDIKDKIITVSGPNGTITRDFRFARTISIEKQEHNIKLFVYFPRKAEKSLINTLTSHIQNMIYGAKNNYIYRMKVVYAHFPMTIKVEGKRLFIENFLGERAPRIAKIYGEKTKVSIEGDDIIIESPVIEEVGQTAANIQLRTKIKNKDPRVFQDGIFVYQKSIGDKDFWKLKY